jgi:hypothetical protein
MGNFAISFAADNIDDVLKNIVKGEPGLLLFFYGADNDFRKLGEKIEKTKIPYIGCMDAGRLVTGKYLLDEKSVVGMSIPKEAIEKLLVYTIDLSPSKSRDAVRKESQEKMMQTASVLGIDLANPDMERDILINLVYGLSSANPLLEGQSKAGMMLQTVGGSSGGKTDFKVTNVISSAGNGTVGVCAMIRLSRDYKFAIDRISSFSKPGDTILTVTKLSDPRHILEINNKPAIDAYCEAIGIPVQSLNSGTFADFTLGIEPGDKERLITSIMATDGATGLLTYNDIIVGTQFNLYKAKSQLEDRAKTLGALKSKNCIAFISFDCILCYLARNSLKEVPLIAKMYEDVIPDVPKIGFGTFSENICGANINQTETFLAIYKAS